MIKPLFEIREGFKSTSRHEKWKRSFKPKPDDCRKAEILMKLQEFDEIFAAHPLLVFSFYLSSPGPPKWITEGTDPPIEERVKCYEARLEWWKLPTQSRPVRVWRTEVDGVTYRWPDVERLMMTI